MTATGDLSEKRGERVRATPAARRLARALGVSLADVASGLGGKLVREDDVRTFVDERKQ